MRSDPRGGRLKKSRRNREAIHGDFHSGEADALANYASPSRLECDSSGCPLRLAKAEKDVMRSLQNPVQGISVSLTSASGSAAGGHSEESESLTLRLCRARGTVTIDQ